MDILVDTGVLLRLVIPSDTAHPEARDAVRILKSRGDRLITLPQNAAEFRNVCTRPSSARSGYNLSIQDTAKKLRLVERLIEIRPASQAAFQEWKSLVVAHSVRGVQVHDARIVAAMNVQGINHIVSFNAGDFRRYSGITATLPRDV